MIGAVLVLHSPQRSTPSAEPSGIRYSPQPPFTYSRERFNDH